MTRIALYSGATILAKGLDSILRHDGTFELLPPCSSLDGLMARIANDAPEIILLDHTLDVTFALVAEIKQAARGAKLVLWVDTITTQMAMQALELGIRGILRKRLPVDLHLVCLMRVQAGGVWFEKALTQPSPAPARMALTAREEQLVSLLSQGLKNSEIASSLAITESTVRIYLSQLYQKLGVKDRFELALYGLKNLASKPGAVPHVPAVPSVATDEPRPQDAAPKRLPLPLVPTLQ
jgi:two-component system, NarL family, nitrate/nitrite response regulator NarL